MSDETFRLHFTVPYPGLWPAEQYAELNPGGTTEIVHVITTLEAR